jgi:hypothetical protein
MVQALQGIVPDEMLLKQIPWIEDPKQALDLLRKQEDEAAQRQAKAFDMPVNAPVNDSGSAAPKE